MNRQPRQASGITRQEVLILICVTLVLACIYVAYFYGGSHYNSQTEAAKIFTQQEIGNPLRQYKTDTGSFPTTAQGLAALNSPSTGISGWHGPYLKIAVVLDPWKSPYHYAYPGKHNPTSYDCWSSGPDGVDGTADDIGNW